MSSLTLTKTRLQAGYYEGVLTRTGGDKSTPILEMRLLEKPVGQINIVENKLAENSWLLSISIPGSVLTDGVQTFLIIDTATQKTLDSFAIITGEPLEDDIRAEVSLLRDELDMLKNAFRRHCVETS